MRQLTDDGLSRIENGSRCEPPSSVFKINKQTSSSIFCSFHNLFFPPIFSLEGGKCSLILSCCWHAQASSIDTKYKWRENVEKSFALASSSWAVLLFPSLLIEKVSQKERKKNSSTTLEFLERECSKRVFFFASRPRNIVVTLGGFHLQPEEVSSFEKVQH